MGQLSAVGADDAIRALSVELCQSGSGLGGSCSKWDKAKANKEPTEDGNVGLEGPGSGERAPRTEDNSSMGKGQERGRERSRAANLRTEQKRKGEENGNPGVTRVGDIKMITTVRE
jgi:hypothetical protein